MNKIFNFQLFFRKPKIVVVTGAGAACAREAILQVIKSKFRIGNDVLVMTSDLKDEKESDKLKSLAGKSPLFVFVVTHFGEIPSDKDSFAAEKEVAEEALNFAKILPNNAFMVLNFDDKTVREIRDITNLKTCTFGFEETADFRASDINSNGGTNFKINFKDNIVPVWLEGILGKEQIYSVLAAVCVGMLFDLNLVEISQSLKDYHGC